MPGAVGASDAYDTGGLAFPGDLFDWTKLSPTKLGGDVVSIVSQGERLLFLRDDGVVFVWRHAQTSPRVITSAPSGIVKMVGGGGCVHVLTDGGEIWSAGSNSVGQAGILASSNTTSLNALSNSLATSTAGIPQDDRGRLYRRFGYGKRHLRNKRRSALVVGGWWRDLARGSSAGVWGAPVEITDPDIDDVEFLHDGHHGSKRHVHSTSSGVYIWGSNTNGSLGQGYHTPTTGSGVPIPLQRWLGFCGRRPSAVSKTRTGAPDT